MCPLVNKGVERAAAETAAFGSNGNGRQPAGAGLLGAAFNALAASVAIVDARGYIVAVNEAWRRYAHDNGMRWHRYGVGYSYLGVLDATGQNGDETVAQMAMGLRRVLAGQAESCQIEYACETPAGCHFALQITGFEYGSARYAMIAHENQSLRKINEDVLRAASESAEAGRRQEAARREAAEDGRRIAEAVGAMLAIASIGLPLEESLQRMVESARQALGTQGAAVYRAEERWDWPVLIAGSGVLPPAGRNRRPAISPAILAQVLATGRGVAIPDLRETALGDGVRARTAERMGNPRGLLVIPVNGDEGIFGYLALFYAEPRPFAEAEVELAHRFGRPFDLAIQNARLRSRAEKVAVENERSRLARDLHDAVTQTLFSASVVAEALPRVWDRNPPEARKALEELRLWTRGALAEMRTLLMELRPAALMEKPLADLIRQLSDSVATRLSAPPECELDAQVEPPADAKLAFYRIAQEALNNVVKHAHATRVVVAYRARPEGMELSVADNGEGFDPESHTPGQLGLRIMQERVHSIGGTLTVRSAAGSGTEVWAEWRPGGRKSE